MDIQPNLDSNSNIRPNYEESRRGVGGHYSQRMGPNPEPYRWVHRCAKGRRSHVCSDEDSDALKFTSSEQASRMTSQSGSLRLSLANHAQKPYARPCPPTNSRQSEDTPPVLERPELSTGGYVPSNLRYWEELDTKGEASSVKHARTKAFFYQLKFNRKLSSEMPFLLLRTAASGYYDLHRGEPFPSESNQ